MGSNASKTKRPVKITLHTVLAPATDVPAPETEDKKAGTPVPDEPQNPLTRKFTKDEWKALTEFRAKLPYIFETAFPEKEKRLSAITLWGVPIDPLNPLADARVSVVLVKFLRARELNVEDATDVMISTLKWRDEFKTDELAAEEFPRDVFGPVAHVFGRDKDGRPVTYTVYGANKDTAAVFVDVPRFIRWRFQLMERSVTLIDFVNVDSMVQVHDYEGFSLASHDANTKAAAAQALKILQDYYPEFISKTFFVNVPILTTWFFRFFKPLLSANMWARVSVVGRGTVGISKTLLPVIDPKELPKRYGGDAQAF